MTKRTLLLAAFALAVLSATLPVFAADASVTVSTSIALHGAPKYAPGFANFDYVNPAAPKGGTLRQGTIGTYDNFNRWADRGVSAESIDAYMFDTLMGGSLDEVDVYYPLIAEKVEYPADFAWITFYVNPAARATDGKPITAADVVFSFEKFLSEGVPQFAKYYGGIKAEALDARRARFTLPEPDKEKAISLASQKILPKAYWSTRKLSDPLTEVPVGSGAYAVKDYKMGQYVTYGRIKDYWAADLPVNRGLNNFDAVRFDYYRDETVAFEAFKAGEYDVYEENIAKNWATMYTGKQFDSGSIVKETIPDLRPQGMPAFTYNIQRPFFQDRRVREALGYALDFEWLNKNYFYDQYTRSRSYFGNTPFEATGLPSAEELAILKPIKDKIPAEALTKEYRPPVTDGTGNVRAQTRAALALLKQAGWEVNKEGKLANVKTGEPMRFEMLIYSQTSERIVAALQKNLEKLGVTMTIRLVDTTQFVNRMRSRDYDMIYYGYSAVYYPSSDLQIIWGSNYLDSTYNQAGVQDPAVDYLLDGIVERLTDEKAVLAWTRALDRVLTFNYYVIPTWHLAKYRVAYWNKFGRPKTPPRYSLGVDTWWVDAAKESKLPKK